jgi:class 3 adenylate cyclase
MTPSSYTSTVAFLMSDIEGSTRIAAATGEAFPRLLDEHYELLANAIGRAGGSVVSTEGDAVFAVFPSAREAATAAIEAQRALAAHEWPIGGEIRVRIGVHAGEATVHDGRYAGIDIHRAARITAAGWGDQILASESARALSGDTLPAGATFRDLGLHNLKDFPAAEHLYQVVAPASRARARYSTGSPTVSGSSRCTPSATPTW